MDLRGGTSKRLQHYFQLLVRGGYLEQGGVDGSGRAYRATPRGRKLLENINAAGTRIDVEGKLGT